MSPESYKQALGQITKTTQNNDSLISLQKDHSRHTADDAQGEEKFWKAAAWTTGVRGGEHGCEGQLKAEANCLCFPGSCMG